MKNPTLKELFKEQENKGFASIEFNKNLEKQEQQREKERKLKIKKEAEEFVRKCLESGVVASAIVNKSYYVRIYSFNENDDNSLEKRELYDGIIEVLEENEIPFEDNEEAGIYHIRIVIRGNIES